MTIAILRLRAAQSDRTQELGPGEIHMTTAVRAEPMIEASPSRQARLAGFFWLMTAVCGSYAMTGDRLIVYRDAAATAANILGHEFVFRLANVSNMVAGACYLVATVFVYSLLKPVNKNVSLVAAFFSLAGYATAGVAFVLRLAPLVVLGPSTSPSAIPVEQLQALALASLRLNAQAFYISHVFFGLHCFLVGYLILRSIFIPRVIGGIMVFAGLGWLTMSFSNLLSPAFARSLFPYVMAPGILGEITLSLWLLIAGVNTQRWNQQAGATR